uniref:Uncharacterized protein n=1 Tax=Rhizophora mucronata TaxID=61149 RepID=A0A2P2PST7_RHIMU
MSAPRYILIIDNCYDHFPYLAV